MKKFNLLLLLLFSCIILMGCQMGGTSGTGGTEGGGETPDPDSNASILDINYEMHTIQYKFDPLTETEYSYLYMGYYPQTEIKDDNIIKALKKIETVNDRGYIEYNGHEYLKYEVVYNHKYAQEGQNTDDVFEFGTGYKPGTIHYFLVQPIAWKVLKSDPTTNTYFLQTEMIIDSRSFHYTNDTYQVDGKTYFATNYEHSEIRNWLNSEFIDLCFTDEEKAFIQETINKNEPVENYITSDLDFSDTTDYFFLLSYQEVISTEYGFLNGGLCDSTRFATATDLSNAKGLIKHTVNGKDSSIWLTRNSYEADRFAINYVGYDGFATNDFYPDADNVGIRPCCTITLNK